MIRKHSVSLHGHRTSLSLEEPFWQELKAIASDRGLSLAALVAEIDETREASTNLSSALRLHVLDVLKAGAAGD
ncbi:ribbon-helix-helix domain-containing protein [Ciceribacter sp. L1K22]|uniref:ribbon-helix-helix domain-containing protein n=1 Tax=Ciceribacter sp. L1K22 TaxID=2820275 RepID=UPI001ABE53FE|nr:ribbon-helix-helix domain-containing protein [Ciceribacter sp. L1K22]MBO3760793.1 ribbon-helix-helix domain-containing protein [Ciceribacter sp. L1K22]